MGDVRKLVGIYGLVLLGLVSCTGPEQAGRQPPNNDPVTAQGPEICSLLPVQSLAHLTARSADGLSTIGDLTVGADKGQCEVLTNNESGRQSVASIRVDLNQPGATLRVNTAIQAAKERSARTPLANPLLTGTNTAPSIWLAITCANRKVQIGINIGDYDTHRSSLDADMTDLINVAAAKYGEKAHCKPAVAPPLSEEQRGTVRTVAGNGGLDLPTAGKSGPETSIGHVEALTTLSDGTIYLVSRKYTADTNPRSTDDNALPWGQTLRIVRVRPDGTVETAWDPNLAPFSTNNSPVPGDISEKLRLQGADTLGSVSALTVNGDQAWLIPTKSTATKPTTLARPVRIVQLSTGRAVDLRAIKASADGTRARDQSGKTLADPTGAWNAARFAGVSFDGQTPVLIDPVHAQVWRIDGLADGKVTDASVFPIGTEIASGGSVAALTGGRFAASTPDGGLVILDSHGKVTLSIPTVNADIDTVGRGSVELGRRQLAAAGDDVLVYAMSAQVTAPAVIRVDTRTGLCRTLQVSGYPGPRDEVSDVEKTRFAKGYGTSASATGLFSMGFPVSALGMAGPNVLVAPYGSRILYEFVPSRR